MFSILLGVLLPLWLIIFISLGFGYFLSLVEAPNEGEIGILLESADFFASYWTHRTLFCAFISQLGQTILILQRATK
jgi:hypothetical protein